MGGSIGHQLAVIQPFALAVVFLASAILCFLKAGHFSGLIVAGIGFLIMAAGEPFMGVARIDPNYVKLGNFVENTTIAVGAGIVLLGLLLLGPKR